jgi:hypothetical protein
MNRFEVAILRIVFKIQKPISMSYLVEGFPNDSEDFVLQAINNLVKSGYIRYLYIEKIDHITYNKQKRKEILTIIDPLPELGIERQEESLASKEELKHAASTHNRKNNANWRWHFIYNTQQHVGKVALVMSVIVIGIVSIFSSTIPTSDVYQNFRLSGSNNYHLHDNHHLFDSSHVIVSENSTKNDNGFYSPQYLKAEAYKDNDTSVMTLASVHRNCIQDLSSS